MFSKATMFLFITGITCIGYTPITQTFDNYNKKLIFATAATLLAPYIYKCCTKEEPLSRYDLDQLLAGNNILKNLYYLYIDGFLGTPEKKEGFKMKNKSGSKLSIKPSPKRPATGIIGNIHANIKHLVKASPFLLFIWAIINYEQIELVDSNKINRRIDALTLAKILK